MDPELLWGLVEKGGAPAVIMIVVVMILRGDLVPKWVVTRLEKEIDDLKSEHKEQERLTNRTVSATEQVTEQASRQSVIVAEMLADVIQRRTGPKGAGKEGP